MADHTRRRFLEGLGAAGAAATAPLGATAAGPPSAAAVCSLNGTWGFRFGPIRPEQSEDWTEVTVPHTWNIDPAHSEYWGAAWYRKEFDAPESWRGQWVRLEFEAVYHTATVWVNGKKAGAHERKGYTAFWLDISPLLKPGELNVIVVRVDNAFRENMLPRERSYDWVADGGITRPVSLHVTPRVFLEHVWVDTDVIGGGQTARVRVRCLVRNTTGEAADVSLSADVTEEQTGRTVLRIERGEPVKVAANSRREITLGEASIREPKLWHFDHPHLYRLDVNLSGEYTVSQTFGVRRIEIRDAGFYLNGERVWLTGVERMAGSNPDYGMAEPESWIRHDHDDMKELNCVFTRVHWPQDRRVLDYCDRHGILIQTEVPSWGSRTFRDLTPELEAEIQQNGLEQLREMIERDRNHPSIFSWGLCNEVNGRNPTAKKFVRRMYAEAKKLDPSRPLTYASNSLQKGDIAEDVAGEMDFVMWNEYYESWMKGDVPAMEVNLLAIHQAFPSKPIVISEYGYCECRPQHSGGDPKRIDILKRHTEVYRRHDWVAGTIFFDYNDYRTHIGDKGIGPLKQRVHGVVDLYGARKPSFAALRQEASPVESLRAKTAGRQVEVTLRTRRRLPGYRLRGYTLRWIVYGFGGLPMEAGEAKLPAIVPGGEHRHTIQLQSEEIRSVRVDVLRPTRFPAASVTSRTET